MALVGAVALGAACASAGAGAARCEPPRGSSVTACIEACAGCESASREACEAGCRAEPASEAQTHHVASGEPPPSPPATSASPARAQSVSPATDAGVSPARAQSVPPADPFAGTSFPPADFEPPHAASAREGHGRWVRYGDAKAGERAAEGRAVLYTTTVHPHEVSRFLSVTVVAIDLKHASVHWLPGIDDPNVDDLDPPAGLVPPPQHDRLLAVFNGGFLARHGHWGMSTRGRELVAAREGGCTIGLYRDGRVRIRSHGELADELAQMETFRQTPVCLVEQGALHPLLEAGKEDAWGGRDPAGKTRRRSALGIDASGRVLFYGHGSEVGPAMLGRGMRYAGAVDVAQLDINWSWTRFVLYGKPSDGTELHATSTLVPQTVHSRLGYVSRKAHRDFFYVLRREP